MKMKMKMKMKKKKMKKKKNRGFRMECLYIRSRMHHHYTYTGGIHIYDPLSCRCTYRHLIRHPGTQAPKTDIGRGAPVQLRVTCHLIAHSDGLYKNCPFSRLFPPASFPFPLPSNLCFFNCHSPLLSSPLLYF